jgi:hypothetical protein
MTHVKYLVTFLLDLAMIVLAINAVGVLLAMFLRPFALGIMMQAFVWLLPITALVVLLDLATDRSPTK